MNIDVLLQPLKEIILFNSFESLFYLGMFLVVSKIYVGYKKIIFHIFMLSIFNYIISNTISVFGWMQLANLLSLSLYFTIMFKTNIFKNIGINMLAFCFFFVIEIGLAIIYKSLFNIELISMPNDFHKFTCMILFRVIEILFIYLVYKLLKKGGMFHYGKNNKTYY